MQVCENADGSNTYFFQLSWPVEHTDDFLLVIEIQHKNPNIESTLVNYKCVSIHIVSWLLMRLGLGLSLHFIAGDRKKSDTFIKFQKRHFLQKEKKYEIKSTSHCCAILPIPLMLLLLRGTMYFYNIPNFWG